jgi:hypothetical protein
MRQLQVAIAIIAAVAALAHSEAGGRYCVRALPRTGEFRFDLRFIGWYCAKVAARISLKQRTTDLMRKDIMTFSSVAPESLAILVIALGFVALGISLMYLGLSRRHRGW